MLYLQVEEIIYSMNWKREVQRLRCGRNVAQNLPKITTDIRIQEKIIA